MKSAVKSWVGLSVLLLLLQPALAVETSVSAGVEQVERSSSSEVNGHCSLSDSSLHLQIADIAGPTQGTHPITTDLDSFKHPVLEQLLRKNQSDEPGIINNLNLPHPASDPASELAEDTELPLSIPAMDIAEALNLTAQLRRLHQLKHHYLISPKYEEHVELMELRMDLLETLFSAFLDSRDTIASMDTEAAKFDAIADVMESNRDKRIRNNTVLNFASSGVLQAFASAIQVGTVASYQNAGNEIEVVQAAIQTLLSTVALRVGKSGKRSAAMEPNMLAPVLGRSPVDYSKYPPVVWKFLNMRPAKTGDTRREALINHWVEVNRIQPLNKRGSAQELDQICGTVELKKELTIDLLRNRIPMIEDTRAVVATMVQAMREIMTFVRRP